MREAHRIWWAELREPTGRWPVLLLSRNDAYEFLSKFIAAEVTSNIGRIANEVPLGEAESLPKPFAVSYTHLDVYKRQVLTGEAQPTGRLPVDRIMTLDLVLPLSNREGVQSFLRDIYDPGSPNFHHFLTPQEFTERFGPSQSDYEAVVSFAKMHGFQVVGGSRDLSLIHI